MLYFEYFVNNLVEDYYFSSNSILINKYKSVGIYSEISDFDWKYGQYDILDSSINWNRVNDQLQIWRSLSENYLKESLVCRAGS